MSQLLNTRVEMELSRNDFRSIFLFKFKLGDTAAHTAVELCEAFGSPYVSVKTAERRFKNFVRVILISKTLTGLEDPMKLTKI